jgi:hypothetical protein
MRRRLRSGSFALAVAVLAAAGVTLVSATAEATFVQLPNCGFHYVMKANDRQVWSSGSYGCTNESVRAYLYLGGGVSWYTPYTYGVNGQYIQTADYGYNAQWGQHNVSPGGGPTSTFYSYP